MSPAPLNLDTSPEIEEMQIEAWRRMAPEEKAAIVTGLTRASFTLALAGIRQRHPEASEHEQRLRLALVTHGSELALKVFPEIATLDRR
jgi:hypothetical protein